MCLKDIQNQLGKLEKEAGEKDLPRLAKIIKKHIQEKGKAIVEIFCDEGQNTHGIGRIINRTYICGKHSITESTAYDRTPTDFQEALDDGIENIEEYLPDYKLKINKNQIEITQQ